MRDDDDEQQLKIELLSQWKLEAESSLRILSILSDEIPALSSERVSAGWDFGTTKRKQLNQSGTESTRFTKSH